MRLTRGMHQRQALDGLTVSVKVGMHAGGRKKGDKSRLANMWSKAPAVKEKPAKASTSKAQAVPAVDADAAIRSAQQVSSDVISDTVSDLHSCQDWLDMQFQAGKALWR